MKYVALMALVPEDEIDDVHMPDGTIQVVQPIEEEDVTQEVLTDLASKLIEAFGIRG